MREGATKSTNLRPLTSDEIERILDSIEPNKFLPDPIASKTLNDVRRFLRLQLESIKEVNPKIIDLFIEVNRNRYLQAIAKPGTMVGLHASESIMAPFAQATLDSHRLSGALNEVNSGVDRMREVITATEKIKNPSMILIYKNPLITFREALESRSYIVGSTLSSLVVTRGTVNGNKKDVIGNAPDWYEVYAAISNNKSYLYDNLPDYVLRIQLSAYKMYINRITTHDVCKVLEGSSSKLICIPSPNKVGPSDSNHSFVDVYPMTEHRTTNAASNFIRSVIIPSMDNIVIKGVKGVVALEPSQTDIWSSVYRLRRKDGDWDLFIDKNKVATQGMRIDNLRPLIQYVGLKEIAATHTSMTVSVPEELSKLGIEGEVTPDSVMRHYDDLNYKRKEEFETASYSDTECGVRKPTEFDLVSAYTYARTMGINMKGIIDADVVDPYNSFPSDVNNIYKLFGIEAARSFIVSTLISLITSGGSGINIRHVLILADMMTSRGIITKITQQSIQSAGPGFFTRATFIKPFTTFMEAAMSGEAEDVGNLATSLLTGQLAKVGTGYSKHFQPTRIVDGEEVGEVDLAKEILRKKMLSPTTGLTDEQIRTLEESVSISLQIIETQNRPMNDDEISTTFASKYISIGDEIVSNTDMGEVEALVEVPDAYEIDVIPTVNSLQKPTMPEIPGSIHKFDKFPCPPQDMILEEETQQATDVQDLVDKEIFDKIKQKTDVIMNDPISLIPEVKNDMNLPPVLLGIIVVPIRETAPYTESGVAYRQDYAAVAKSDVPLVNLESLPVFTIISVDPHGSF